MAGKRAVKILLLLCCTLVNQIIGVQDDVKVVNVPPEFDQIQNFLKFERHRINGMPETDVTTEDASDMQKPREMPIAGDTATPFTTLDINSNSVELENIIEESIPELTQNFLNMEKKYANNLPESLMASTSEEDHLKEIEDDAVTDTVSLPNSDDSNINEIEDVQVTDMALDPKIVENFIGSEIYHTYSTDSGNMGLESMTFNAKSLGGKSSSDVDVCGTVNLNKILDELLDGLRHDIVERGLDNIKIPDIYETFVKRVGIIDMKGYFQGEEGWAKNLSTIHRTADAIASSQGKDLKVSCGFGLSSLEFGYDKYKAKFMKIGPSGKLDVSISKNSVLINATVSWNNNTCKTTLDYLSLNRLGGFNLKITGLGPLNWLLTKVSDWLFKKFHEEIREKVEDTLKQQIEKQLKNFDCAQYLLGWHKFK